MNRKVIYIGAGVLLLIGVIFAFFFFRSAPAGTTQTNSGFFGIGENVSTTGTTGGQGNVAQGGTNTAQKVFEIATGPVAGATFTQTFSPTTTLARYVMADNGHVFDLALGVPGSAAKPVSNTTIPGVVSAQWGKNGSSTVLQYVDSGVVKSLYLGFASSTATAPTRIQFLPNNITSLALSPDGTSVAYLLKTSAGVDGYIGNTDGTNAKKLFSLPLSQVLVLWPAATTLLTQTKSAVGVPGIAFSVNIKTGVANSLLYTPGLSAVANSLFSKIVYQTSPDETKATTYAHDVATGKDAPIANNPLPEKCAWDTHLSNILYCAVSLDPTPANYLDLWHSGLVQTSDSIVMFDTNTGAGTVLTLPGDGGASASIDSLTVSPDGQYLLFITRGDHSLWGVRLTQ